MHRVPFVPSVVALVVASVALGACLRSQAASPSTTCRSSKECPNAETCDTARQVCVAGCGDTGSDPANCGHCGHVCAAPAGGRTSCVAGRCAGGCSEGSTLCDEGHDGGGACVATQSDAANCGECGRTCAAPKGGSAACVAGQCIGSCPPEKLLCGALAGGGGVCADTSRDPDNCAACGQRCEAPEAGAAICAAARCLGACPDGEGVCGAGPRGGGSCRDLGSDRENCGRCGHACTAPSGGAPACVRGHCTGACPPGLTGCGGTEDGGGRCVDLMTDPDHCGGCGNLCAGVGGSGSCVNAVCSACPAGTTECRTAQSGGIRCSDVSKDPSNCGGCGNRCDVAHSCIDARCKMCAQTFASAEYVANDNPAEVALGDLNGDGLLDAVVGANGVQKLSVFLNAGAGVLGSKTDYPTAGLTPSSIALADFDGDGELDVAVGGYNATSVLFLKGRGNGAFDAPTSTSVGLTPWRIAVGDVNGDGKPDLVATDGTSVAILRNLSCPCSAARSRAKCEPAKLPAVCTGSSGG